jgi:peptidoglycan hydrolase CwlO-like protein
MDITEKLTAWDKQKADIVARYDDLHVRQEQLDTERRQLEADAALLPPLEAVLTEEISAVTEQRMKAEAASADVATAEPAQPPTK